MIPRLSALWRNRRAVDRGAGRRLNRAQRMVADALGVRYSMLGRPGTYMNADRQMRQMRGDF